MKWSSHSVARTYKRLIFASAAVLLAVGLISGYNGSNASFSRVFLAFIVLMSVAIFWNLLGTSNRESITSKSSPGVIKLDSSLKQSHEVEITENNTLPNPLDEDLDIPLM